MTLYIVGTPIGNLKDITLRALEVLKSVDRIYCEDTRVSKKLLSHYGIHTPLSAYHDHSGDKIELAIVAALKEGKEIALISDAGMPLISDPGFQLIKACQREELKTTVVPGASSVIAGLALSGMTPDRFMFGGFLPAKSGARQTFLKSFHGIESTLIFFESARRLVKSLEDVNAVFGNVEIAVCREMTKIYEEARRGPLSDILDHYTQHPPKGEIVLLIESHKAPSTLNVEDELRQALKTLKTKDAAEQVAALTGLPKKDLYAQALALKDSIDE